MDIIIIILYSFVDMYILLPTNITAVVVYNTSTWGMTSLEMNMCIGIYPVCTTHICFLLFIAAINISVPPKSANTAENIMTPLSVNLI